MQCPRASDQGSPVESDDLTFVIAPDGGHFVVLESPRTAEDKPRYERVAVAPSAEGAQAYITYRQAAYWG